MITTFTILLFIILVAIVALLRVKTNGQYEIKITDAIFALIPVIILLLLSGQISELQVGDLTVKLKEDLEKKIVEESDLKNSTFLDGKKSLVIGVDCDYKVEDDINSNHPMPGGIPYKYVVFLHNCVDDKHGNRRAQFWGIISFEDYQTYFLMPHSEFKGKVFLSWVKAKNINKLKTIPSFVNVENSMNLDSNKLSALEKMETLNVDFLPIVNNENLFLGVITKQKLTSSLVLNIATSLK